MLVSDLLVWVEHNSDLGSNSLWWQVLGEFGSNDAGVSVTADNLTPDALVVHSSAGVLLSVDECDAFSMVPAGGGSVIASLNLDECLSLLLSSLSTLESHERTLGVKSTQRVKISLIFGLERVAYLTGAPVILVVSFLTMSTFNLIFM